MLEVEVKYRNADRAAAVATLLDWGAALAQDRTDADLYFSAPDRDLKATDEAFRLRRIGASGEAPAYTRRFMDCTFGDSSFAR